MTEWVLSSHPHPLHFVSSWLLLQLQLPLQFKIQLCFYTTHHSLFSIITFFFLCTHSGLKLARTQQHFSSCPSNDGSPLVEFCFLLWCFFFFLIGIGSSHICSSDYLFTPTWWTQSSWSKNSLWKHIRETWRTRRWRDTERSRGGKYWSGSWGQKKKLKERRHSWWADVKSA